MRRDRKPARPYADPYLAGVGLGLVLLGAFVVAGRGLGASGAFASVASATLRVAAPATASSHPYFGRYLAGQGPSRDWVVYEILGVVAGGFLSAAIAHRLGSAPGAPRPGLGRLAIALTGGVAMGVGAVLARGCTSGQALTGGALLSVGSWAFMLATFAGAYALAPLVRRLWT